MIPVLRAAITALRGRVCCSMSMCGRPARFFGYCTRHLDNYHYMGRP